MCSACLRCYAPGAQGFELFLCHVTPIKIKDAALVFAVALSALSGHLLAGSVMFRCSKVFTSVLSPLLLGDSRRLEAQSRFWFGMLSNSFLLRAR